MVQRPFYEMYSKVQQSQVNVPGINLFFRFSGKTFLKWGNGTIDLNGYYDNKTDD